MGFGRRWSLASDDGFRLTGNGDVLVTGAQSAMAGSLVRRCHSLSWLTALAQRNSVACEVGMEKNNLASTSFTDLRDRLGKIDDCD